MSYFSGALHEDAFPNSPEKVTDNDDQKIPEENSTEPLPLMKPLKCAILVKI